jgi:hypothetical protein
MEDYQHQEDQGLQRWEAGTEVTLLLIMKN